MRHNERTNVNDLLESGARFLTCGGPETHLIFRQGVPLRDFCAFEILDDDDIWSDFEDQFLRPIADAAAETGFGLITDALVWRASPDYVTRLGYSRNDVARFNHLAVRRVRDFFDEWSLSRPDAAACPVILAADLGPRGDGYGVAAHGLRPGKAFAYHMAQVEALADTDVQVVVALTMTNANEAIGVISAARECDLPIIVSPTVETDGALPDGMPLGVFVQMVDDETDGYALFHIVNCAYPTHVEPALIAARNAGESWRRRVRGLRANASTKSHQELDNSTELDRGDIEDLARRMAALHSQHDFVLLGGCCGTDAEHIRAIAEHVAGEMP